MAFPGGAAYGAHHELVGYYHRVSFRSQSRNWCLRYRRLQRSEERGHWGRPAGNLATSDACGRVSRDRIESASLFKDMEQIVVVSSPANDIIAIAGAGTWDSASDCSHSNEESQNRAKHPGQREETPEQRQVAYLGTRWPSRDEEIFPLYSYRGISRFARHSPRDHQMD